MPGNRAAGPVTFVVHGADKLALRLKDLAPKLTEREVKRIMRGAGQEIVKRAKANLTAVDTGLLRDSIGLVVRAPRRGNRVVVVVGARGDAAFTMVDSRTGKVMKRPTKYAHLVEFGTRPHRIVRKGISKSGRPWVQVIDHPGTDPRPFMRPAFDGAGASVQARMQREVKKGLERIVREHDR